MRSMEKHEIKLELGETTILDDNGEKLIKIELTNNMFLVIGFDGNIIQCSWRDVIEAIRKWNKRDNMRG